MSDGPSLARQFFDEFLAAPDRAALLRAFVNSDPPSYETDWLEFKVGNVADDKAKTLWSEALAGFATTEGGVLIWGIFAAPDPANNLDHAHSVVPVAKPEEFAARLRQLHPQSTDPPVLGVIVEPVIEPDGRGFVVCYVPECKFKPYRAESAGRNYYVCAGGSFIVPPPSLLRSLFYPTVRPQIEISVLPSWGEPHGDGFHGSCIVNVSNTGTATAKSTIIQTPSGLKFQPVGGRMGIGTAGGRGFMSEQPIHPGMTVRVGAIELKVEKTTDKDTVCLADPINLTFNVMGEDQPRVSIGLVIPVDSPTKDRHVIKGTTIE